MALDDAGTEPAEVPSASGAGPSLSVATTAAASASGRQTSDPQRAPDSAAAAKPNQPPADGHVDAVAALQQQLARVQHELLEIHSDNHVDGSGSSSKAVDAAEPLQTDDAIEYRVVDFGGGGVYRGQVRLSVGEICLPHGVGVLTTADESFAGQWVDGRQVGHGTHYSTTLEFEGDFGHEQNYGVGFYTFGTLFVGRWCQNAATLEDMHRYPYGLGSLQRWGIPDVVGWFKGLRCVHKSPFNNAEAFKLPPSVRLQSQPARGLLVADEKLQFWRRAALLRALSSWSRLCSGFAIEKAKRSRLLAVEAQQRARQAEQRAIREDQGRQKERKSQDAAELLDQLAKAREAQDRRQHRRQLHAQRLARAIEQRNLAQACVTKQQIAVTTLESEWQEILTLLDEARQAQDDCARHARELHILKRQIENASVKINAVRFGDQRIEHRQDTAPASEPVLTQRSVLSTPAKKTPRQRDGSAPTRHDPVPRSSHRSSVTLHQQFVCGVPDCTCGIPRDVFRRAGAALNDE